MPGAPALRSRKKGHHRRGPANESFDSGDDEPTPPGDADAPSSELDTDAMDPAAAAAAAAGGPAGDGTGRRAAPMHRAGREPTRAAFQQRQVLLALLTTPSSTQVVVVANLPARTTTTRSASLSSTTAPTSSSLVDRARSERMWRGAPAPLRAVADAMGLARAVPLTALRASVSDVDKCIRRLQRKSAPPLADGGSEAAEPHPAKNQC